MRMHWFFSDISKLHSLMPLWMTLTFIQGDGVMGKCSCKRKQNLFYSLSGKFFGWSRWNLVCCCDLLVCLCSYWIYFPCSIFKERNITNLTIVLKKKLFHIASHLDAYEPIVHTPIFKLSVIETTKLHNMVLVWKTLTFMQHHKVARNLELVQSFCCRNGLK